MYHAVTAAMLCLYVRMTVKSNSLWQGHHPPDVMSENDNCAGYRLWQHRTMCEPWKQLLLQVHGEREAMPGSKIPAMESVGNMWVDLIFLLITRLRFSNDCYYLDGNCSFVLLILVVVLMALQFSARLYSSPFLFY